MRIIGGTWRGRRLRVAALPGLRPTADRTRETLFNWLQPVLPGARCLDLFAGSGALGFEAASRGAGRVVLVERAGAAVRVLRAMIEELAAADRIEIVQDNALRYLKRANGPFDVVFLDPPFAGDLLAPACRLLDTRQLLAPDALVFLETDSKSGLPALPTDWKPYREQQAGQVQVALMRHQPARPVPEAPAPGPLKPDSDNGLM